MLYYNVVLLLWFLIIVYKNKYKKLSENWNVPLFGLVCPILIIEGVVQCYRKLKTTNMVYDDTNEAYGE